jgi:hypothetical protein
MTKIKARSWIQIRIGTEFNDFVDPDFESGSRAKKKKKIKGENIPVPLSKSFRTENS